MNPSFKEKGYKAVHEMLDSSRIPRSSSRSGRNSLNSEDSEGSYRNHLQSVKKILHETLTNKINSFRQERPSFDSLKSTKLLKTNLSMKKTPPPRPPPPLYASRLVSNFPLHNEENFSNRSICSESEFAEKFRLNNFLGKDLI